MEAGLTPQEAIAQALPKPEKCDLVVVILWERIGTPLPDTYRKTDGSRYRSGTEWEYVNAIESFRRRSKPSVWIYHRTEPFAVAPYGPELEAKQWQRSQLHAFLESLDNPDGSIAGGVNPYSSPHRFDQDFEQHLRDALERFVSNDATRAWRARVPLPKAHLVVRAALLNRVKETLRRQAEMD